jgi:uncharacterized protein (DUF924 family)
MTGQGTTTDPMEPGWVTGVLQFWFGDLRQEQWFVVDAAVDREIRARFLALHGQLQSNEGIAVDSRRAVLAAVIVLDQFSRNMFRGTARAFASDEVARRLARQAIEKGLDLHMSTEERFFLYLPFEHSEDLADQARAVALIGQLGRDDWTRYAEAHRSLIERFGRFPHRNAVLGRESTAEETAALAAPMGSF